MNTLRNFAKPVFAHIFAKFEYFAKPVFAHIFAKFEYFAKVIIYLKSPDHVLYTDI